jgi:hypothetical protein
MTFSLASKSKGLLPLEETWEISRFCSAVPVVGAAGKMLEYFKKNYKWKEIFSFADRRWGEGELYSKIGMTLRKITQPNYWYFEKSNPVTRLHRYNFPRHTLKGEGTEWEIMQRNGYDRIWDCGNVKYSVKKEGT